jgi:hypothetical protein
MGECRQKFKAEMTNGAFEGVWTGSGGGGKWRLYKDTFNYRTINVSLSEADFEEMKPDGASIAVFKPSSAHNDFYLAQAALVAEIATKDNVTWQFKLVCFAGDKPVQLGITPRLSANITAAAIPVTALYINPRYDRCAVSLNRPETEKPAEVKLSVDITHAVPLSKAKLDRFFAEIANTNKTTQNNRKDSVIKLTAALFGAVVTEINIAVEDGTKTREWSTAVNSGHPGIAVMAENEIINNLDGTVYYPLQKFENSLYLYIDKVDIIEAARSITVKLTVDGRLYSIKVGNKK